MILGSGVPKPDGRDGLSYRDAGVDIDAADALVSRIAPIAKRTHGPEVVAGIGGFASLYSLRTILDDAPVMLDPLLVAGTDGVGTKLKVAIEAQRHDTIGIDLVAMCVNDIVTTGARPLFFLDYFGTGRLQPDVAAAVVEGIATACESSGMALVGGETAELPGLYATGEYDLAGFAVGIVDRAALVDGRSVRPGDRLVGVLSRGLHANGLSLARMALLDRAGSKLTDPFPFPDGHGSQSVADVLLTPTSLYVAVVERWMQAGLPKAMAHITGGGLPGNLPRAFPEGVEIVLDRTRWAPPPVFREIAARGNISADEMFRTFNMGVGFVVAVDAGREEEAIRLAGEVSEHAVVIGEIRAASAGGPARLVWGDGG